MITVTKKAKEELKKTLQASTKDPGISLRLAYKPPRELGVILDEEREGDQVVEYKELKVLLVSKDLSDGLDGVILDVEDTGKGPELTIHTT